MLFRFDDSLKELKKELKNAGADVSYVREWQKVFDKVKKQSTQIEVQYVQAKESLEEVYAVLQELEQLLISCKQDLRNPELRKNILEHSKVLKKYQGMFNQEFLIGKDDLEFHSTYASVLSLMVKDLKEQKAVLILQSEVENLLAIAKEALEKQWPSYRAMAYFYLNYADKEIFDLPHMDKVRKVEAIYQKEFYSPIYQNLIVYMDEARAKQVLEVEVWN